MIEYVFFFFCLLSCVVTHFTPSAVLEFPLFLRTGAVSAGPLFAGLIKGFVPKKYHSGKFPFLPVPHFHSWLVYPSNAAHDSTQGNCQSEAAVTPQLWRGPFKTIGKQCCRQWAKVGTLRWARNFHISIQRVAATRNLGTAGGETLPIPERNPPPLPSFSKDVGNVQHISARSISRLILTILITSVRQDPLTWKYNGRSDRSLLNQVSDGFFSFYWISKVWLGANKRCQQKPGY